MDWIAPQDRRPTRDDGPMANETKVQVDVLTGGNRVERRNYFVASESGGFDDEDLRSVRAWRPLPVTTEVEPYPVRRRWL